MNYLRIRFTAWRDARTDDAAGQYRHPRVGSAGFMVIDAGQLVQITDEAGAPIPAEAVYCYEITDAAPPDPPWSPSGMAVAATLAVNAQRDAKIFGGVAYMGHVFDTDSRSVMNLTGTLAAVTSGALTLPQPFYWRSRDNVNVEMTLADLKGLAAAMVATGYQAYLESWAAKDAQRQDRVPIL